MEIGLRAELTKTVAREDTAIFHGSGALPVLATPALVAWMEKAAHDSLLPFLRPGEGSVGVHIDVAHSRASGIGARIRVESELVERDRRRLVFSVTARDEAGVIGQGTHERFIIDAERFMEKVSAQRPE